MQNKKVFLTSHTLEPNREYIPMKDRQFVVVGPPRTGKKFLVQNIWLYSDGLAEQHKLFQYLDKDRYTVFIVRDPKDWIVSLVTQRMLHEPGRGAKELLDVEVPAALVVLREYEKFNSDNLLLIKYTDLKGQFPKVMKTVCDRFGINLKPLGPPRQRETDVYNFATTTVFPEYQQVLSEIKNYDLSEINDLYLKMLAKTISL